MSRWRSDADARILEKARTFVETITVEDFAALSLPKDALFNPPRSARKPKPNQSWGPTGAKHVSTGGSPPEYTAVELYLDLKDAVYQTYPNMDAITSLYIQLSSMVSR